MKLLKRTLLPVIVLLFLCNNICRAQDSDSWLKKNYVKAELNFIEGLGSGTTGVRANSAYYLGEMKSQVAVNFLTYMIDYDKCPACRIVAALSLLKIGDPEGVMKVKRIREFVPPDTSSDTSYYSYLSSLWRHYLESHPDEAAVLKNIRFPGDV